VIFYLFNRKSKVEERDNVQNPKDKLCGLCGPMLRKTICEAAQNYKAVWPML
jgi:hypothetical protein